MERQQQGLAGAIRRRPITAFLLWFFTVGQMFAFAPLFLETSVPAQWFINASTVVGLLLPTVVITRLVDGPEGLRTLWRRITMVGASPAMYLVGLVVMPLLAFALAVAMLGVPQVAASTAVSALGSALLLSTVVGFLLNNLWEEAAWMGFVQARLQDRSGPMRAAALTAPLFALQHVALFIENGPVATAILLVAFTAVVIPFRAFNGWLYNRTGGSLFLVGLVHALSNAVAPGAGLGAGYLRQLYPNDVDAVGVLHIAALALMGLVVIAATRGRLGLPRQQPREVAQPAPTRETAAVR